MRARAIWLAAQHGDIRRVPIKNCEQQAVLALHRTRQHWVSVRTATVNALRGLLYEFGVVLRGGRLAGLKALTAQRASIDEQLPEAMRPLLNAQLQSLQQIDERIDALEGELAALQRQLDKAIPIDDGRAGRRVGAATLNGDYLALARAEGPGHLLTLETRTRRAATD